MGIAVNQGDERWIHPDPACLRMGENEKIVEILLKDERIEVNQGDKEGITPLWIACQTKYEEIVMILLPSSKEIVRK